MLSVHNKEELVTPLLETAGSRLSGLLIETTESEVLSTVISSMPTNITSWLQDRVSTKVRVESRIPRLPNLIAELSTWEAQRLTWFGSTDLIRHDKLHLEQLVSSNFTSESQLQVKRRSFSCAEPKA